MSEFIKIALIDAFLTQQREVAEDSGNHFITVGLPFVGQGGGNCQHAAVAVYNRIGIGANPFHQPLFLQPVG